MAPIRLYDTRSRELRDLIPRDDGHVGIYACADRLRDELRARGWEVRDGPDGPELVRIEQ